MRTGRQIVKIAFRVLVGLVGLVVLVVSIKLGLYAQSLHAFSVVGGFCGLLLGYSFGGDKWGARLFAVFTGHYVEIDKPDEASESTSPPSSRPDVSLPGLPPSQESRHEH